MTEYKVQVEASPDGRIWDAIESPQVVDFGDATPADFVDAADTARHIGDAPGWWTRVLVWAVDDEALNHHNAIHTDEYHSRVCTHDSHPEDKPVAAVAVLVYYGGGVTIGSDGLCADHAQCTSGGCATIGTVMDSDYQEPWCQAHAEQFSVDEAPTGPDIVLINSDQYRKVEAEAGQ